MSKGAVRILLALGFLSLSSGISGCTSLTQKSHNLSNSEHAKMLIDVANAALIEGDPIGALQKLIEAEKLDASIPDLYHLYALAYYQKHDLPKAIQYARKAVALNKDFSEANNTLGKLLVDNGSFTEAFEPLERAANSPVNREAYKAWTNLGIIYYRLGSFEKSEKMMDRAIQEAPLLACVAHYYRGHIMLKNMKFNEAVNDYDQATRKLCASFKEAYLALGIAYEQSKQYELARQTFLDVERRYPNTKLAKQAIDHIKFLP